jgi:hypothetical protein
LALPTLVSEHTANVRSGSVASVDHSLSDWLSSAMLGTRKSTRPTGWHDLLGQAQAREGLARAARHDQLPAVVLGEAGSHGVDGGALVRAQLLAAERRQHLGGARVELGPVERGADEVFEPDDVDRDLLVLDRRLGGRVEAPGRGHQEAGAERVLARLGEEGVDLPLGQGCLGAEELALHRHEVAGVALAGDEVDAVVGAGAALGPVAPHPHLLEPPGIQRLGDEEGLDEPLEPGALVAGVVVRVVELVEDVVDVDPPGFVAHASTLGNVAPLVWLGAHGPDVGVGRVPLLTICRSGADRVVTLR